MKKKKIRIFYTTCKNLSEAKKLSESLVKNKVAVCTNIFESLTSIYIDEGKVNTVKEVGVIIKSLSTKKSLEKILESSHSYEIPFIGELKVDRVNEKYFKWAVNALK